MNLADSVVRRREKAPCGRSPDRGRETPIKVTIPNVCGSDLLIANAIAVRDHSCRCQAFLPHIKRQQEGGHIVNTSSMAGVLGGMPAWGPYNSTKYAVVGLTEVLRQEGRTGGFGASVLCPGGVNTNIFEAPRNRPSRFGPQESMVADKMTASDISKGINPDIVGRLVLEAIQADRQFIFTDPRLRSRVERRHEKMMADFEWAAESNALVSAGAPGAKQSG